MKINKNTCKGTGRALGYGCGYPVYRFRFGLCQTCYQDWLINSPNGKAYVLKMMIKSKPKKKKIAHKYIKWQDKEFPEMKTYVQEQFCNPYIRLRDIENFGYCISSGKEIQDAGHYFSRGSCESMRFCVQNIHGQCRHSNTTKHGDLENFTAGLINRHGLEYFKELQNLKIYYSKNRILDKNEVLLIGKTYKYLTKKRIWVFTQNEFENYKIKL